VDALTVRPLERASELRNRGEVFVQERGGFAGQMVAGNRELISSRATPDRSGQRRPRGTARGARSMVTPRTAGFAA
jgi:hypothetical protein